MNVSQVRKLFPDRPMYSDEVGRFVSKGGATYRAWHDGNAQVIDADADQRRYGEETGTTFRWKESN